eukprot:jgi/Tetstr1/433282/TSEL_022570.t1
MIVRGVVVDGWSVALLAAVHLHLAAAPFTKVEESFNMQATHDLLFHGANLSAYDHHEFPGVVPRTFTGSLLLAAMSWPWMRTSQLLGVPKLPVQYMVRSMLGCLYVLSMCRLRRAVCVRSGRLAGVWWCLISLCQFHVPFYSTRLLPNSLALVLVNLGAAEWLLQDRPARVVALFAFTSVVLRADMLILAGLVGLQMLAIGQLGVAQGMAWGAMAVVVSLAATVPLDSLLWGRLLWPEGEVLWFNTVLNKSSDWGTSPGHWYWTSALPRAMLGGYPLLPLGLLLDAPSRLPAAVALAYIGLYSMLPHKELRFIMPAVPLLNIPAAAALSRLQRLAFPPAKDDARRSLLARRLALALAAAMALGSLLPTAILLRASHLNYPGGVALSRLHDLGPSTCQDGPVHIGNVAAMTGVTRFLQLGPPWAYSKAEWLQPEEYQQHGFSCLLADVPSVPGYELLESVNGFQRLSLAWRPNQLRDALQSLQLPLEWVVAPQVHILKRVPAADTGPDP